MTRRIAILNVVGLTREHLGKQTPHITKYAEQRSVSSLMPSLPPVTSTFQPSILTGSTPNQQSITSNGWHEPKTKQTISVILKDQNAQLCALGTFATKFCTFLYFEY